jgi:amino acid permease
MNINVFTLLSIMSTCYVAHYNAPKVWLELENPTKKRYDAIVDISFAVVIVANIVIMTMGFLTFGGSSAGFILNNYSKHDTLATAARLTTGFGIVCSYPITFAALRDGVSELLGMSDDNKDRFSFYYLTIAIHVLITSLTTRLQNVGMIISFSGSMIGSLFVYVIPAVMNIAGQQKIKKAADSLDKSIPASGFMMGKGEIMLNYVMIALGSLIGLCGVYAGFHSLLM